MPPLQSLPGFTVKTDDIVPMDSKWMSSLEPQSARNVSASCTPTRPSAFANNPPLVGVEDVPLETKRRGARGQSDIDD